jgi:adenosylcobinamide-phosphate synthase
MSAELYSYIHSLLFDLDRVPVAVIALLVTAIVGVITGPMHGQANPFYYKLLNVFFSAIGARLDRHQRKKRDLVLRGLFFTLLVLAFSWILSGFATALFSDIDYYQIPEIIFLSLFISSGTIWYSLLKLYFALHENKVVKGAYYIIATSTRTDLSASDNFAITRTGMGFAARSFDKAVVAPVIWYLIAGFPAVIFYSSLAFLSWRFGKDGFSKGFGHVPVALEKLMGFIPTIFSGILISLAGLFTPTGGMTRALVSLFKKDLCVSYEQGGLPVTAMAHALDVSLGGPVTDLDGSAIKREWVGPSNATAKLESGHLRRAIYIILMAYMLFIVSVMSTVLYGQMI